MKKLLLLILFFQLSGNFLSNCQNNSLLSISELIFNHGQNPLGIDDRQPVFGWLLKSKERGQYQDAYQILVSQNPDNLKKNIGEVWNSGVVKSFRTQSIPYQGKKLESKMRYWWTVRIWDQAQKMFELKEPSWFEMGILDSAEWKAQWVSDSTDYTAFNNEGRSILLRKSFYIKEKVKKARIYYTGVGYCYGFINGLKLGDEVLFPSFTRYDKRVEYKTEDITSQVGMGENVFSAILGNGFYNVSTKSAWDFNIAPWRNRPALLFQIEIEYANGTHEVFVSDSSVKTWPSPVIFNQIRNGESYDARLEIDDWTHKEFSDKQWPTVKEVKGPSGRLIAPQAPPIRETAWIQAKGIKKFPDGSYVIDFGENIAGYVTLKVNAPRGKEIIVKYGERVLTDGTLDQKELSRFIFTGETQTTRYICRGGSQESWKPWFSYFGFQYVQIWGLPYEPDLNTLIACKVNTDFKPITNFSCSDTSINRIHENTLRTYLGNYHGFPEDCPHREKMGWTGDGHLATETGLLNYNSVNAYIKWLRDFGDEQKSTGQIPGIIPTSGWGYTYGKDSLIMMAGYGPQWEGACIIIPGLLYQATFDTTILREFFPMMQKYISWLNSWSVDNLLNIGIDDHKFLYSNTNPAYISSAFYYRLVALMERYSQILKESEWQRYYSTLADGIKESFNRKYFHPNSMSYGEDNQTSLALPVSFGLVPEKEEEIILGKLFNKLEENGPHIYSGVVGTAALFQILSTGKNPSLLWKILKEKEFPSYGYWISLGATTLWQNWDGSQSRNHIMFCPVDMAILRSVGGFKGTNMKEGRTVFQFEADFIYQLDSMNFSMNTFWGEISFAFHTKENQKFCSMLVPPNTFVEFYFPESGSISFLFPENDASTVKKEKEGLKWKMVLEPGIHRFEFRK